MEDYFEAFDGAQYLPRPWLKTIYPMDTWIICILLFRLIYDVVNNKNQENSQILRWVSIS